MVKFVLNKNLISILNFILQEFKMYTLILREGALYEKTVNFIGRARISSAEHWTCILLGK